ncbi:hypothetical protein MKX01_005178 [Papaver californicum]|nr:hypothetical protein MKX01_005178 [Papaver californicum]
MAKPIPSSKKLQQIARITSEKLINHSKQPKPISENEFLKLETSKSSVDFEKLKQSNQNRGTTPLSSVVSSCVKRWFQDTLKEARDGDSGMQVLVGQMYYNGRAWIAKASRSKSSLLWERLGINIQVRVLKVLWFRMPCYNASDSDSDKLKVDNDER